jgi:hypothetical protein
MALNSGRGGIDPCPAAYLASRSKFKTLLGKLFLRSRKDGFARLDSVSAPLANNRFFFFALVIA